MGGNVFTVGPSPLKTPRMSREVYLTTKERCSSKLKTLFPHVETPVEGPGKEDFGDVDILCVAGDSESPAGAAAAGDDARPVLSQIAELLGAVKYVSETGGRGIAAHFAVPWPENLDKEEQEGQATATGSEDVEVEKKRFIQVDVRVCESRTHLEWLTFRNAHGDMWAILGAVIKPAGLTLDDKALYVRVEEMEKLDRKKARIFLSDRPREVLDFLRLSPGRYFSGEMFESAGGLFEYVSSCRFFCAANFMSMMKSEEVEGEEDKGAGWINEQTKKHRKLYAKFFDEYIPKLVERGEFVERKYTREQVREEAFARFGPGVEDSYEEAKETYLPDLTRVAAHNIISKEVADMVQEAERNGGDSSAGGKGKKATKAIKAVVFSGDTSWGPLVEREGLVDGRGVWDLDGVREWMGKWKGWFFEETYRRSLLEGGNDREREERMERMRVYLEEWEKGQREDVEEAEKGDQDDG